MNSKVNFLKLRKGPTINCCVSTFFLKKIGLNTNNYCGLRFLIFHQ